MLPSLPQCLTTHKWITNGARIHSVTHTRTHKRTKADIWMKVGDIHTEGAINVGGGGRAVDGEAVWEVGVVCVETGIRLCSLLCRPVFMCLLNGGLVPQSVPLYFARFLMIFQWWFRLLCVRPLSPSLHSLLFFTALLLCFTPECGSLQQQQHLHMNHVT